MRNLLKKEIDSNNLQDLINLKLDIEELLIKVNYLIDLNNY